MAQMATTFATTGGTAHSHPVTGLANGQSYTFYVRCQDPAGNATTADTVDQLLGGQPADCPTRSRRPWLSPPRLRVRRCRVR